MTTAQETLSKHGIKLESYAPGRHYTTCPKCSHTRSTPNQKLKVLGITIGEDGSVCWGCNHCTYSGPEKGSGERHELMSYVYCDADGTAHFRKVRNAPGREPRFWLEQPDGRGGWKKGLGNDINSKILYRKDEVTKAIADGRIVACVEGEKDANNLWALGIAATCNAHGASEPGKRPKWTKVHSEQLAGANIVVFNDNDAAGYEHADATCRLSLGVAKRVRKLDLKPHWPEIPKGGDVSDWLALGHGSEDLDKLIAGAPDYQPSAQAQQESAGSETVGSGAAIDDAAEIEKLARLLPLDYDRARKEAGKRLGLSRLSLLDGLVKAKRAELGLDGGDGLQGRAIEFPEPEPWPEPVDGAELLEGLAKGIRRHVVLSDAGRDTSTLWVLHAYLLNSFLVSPRLCVRSPTKGCGKTVLLDVLARLVPRPLPTANVTAAALFRVAKYQPTLLVDEADTFLRDNDELRGILNGNRQGSQVLRTVGEDHEPRAFATFSACVIALIGALPDTLHDRSVIVDLKRRLRTEMVEPFRPDRADHLDLLARKAARWIQDNAERVAATDPEMPVGIINREADNWRCLLMIADVAGGEWPQRARKAAQAAHIAGASDDALLEVLLADIRDTFGASNEMASVDLVDALVAIEGRPWAEFGRSHKALTQNQLARLLKPLGVAPQKVGPREMRTNGYLRAHFEEAFQRYLGSEGVSQPDNRTQCDEIRTSQNSQPDSPPPVSPVAKCEKSNDDGLVSGCPVAKGENRGNGESRASALDAEACAARSPDSPEPCAYCGRAGGNAVAFGDGRSIRLHRDCEAPWIENRMAEEGIWRA
jgi:Protein of unknown function (DUF3631)